MGRIVAATLLAAAVGGLVAVSGTARTTGGGSPAPAAFRLADGSAGCSFDGTRLACRGVGLERAVVLESDGRAYTAEGEPRWDASTPVLKRTESWWHGSFSCRLDAPELVCTTVSGGVLAVGAGRAAASVPPVVLP